MRWLLTLKNHQLWMWTMRMEDPKKGFFFFFFSSDSFFFLFSQFTLSCNDFQGDRVLSLTMFFFTFCSQTNGGKANNGYNVGEKEQWCLSTLGYVKAFSRQYASEVALVSNLCLFVILWF